MKFIYALFFALSVQTALGFQSQPPLIPKVNNYTGMKTPAVEFNSLRIQSDPGFSEALSRVFSQSLKKQFNIPSSVVEGSANLIFKKVGDSPGDQSYTINVNGGKITVTSPSETGAFYATQTLLQMIQSGQSNWRIRSCIIKDSPRFVSRGMMLDEARHFLGKEAVKHLLDTMAAHKMNVFHWHLTNNEGWRIEIKSYPELTSIGAWHGEGTKIRTPKRDQLVKGEDNPKYGGFYTQEDIKEIVAYATERHITIIPEINIPGQSLALCTAIPEMLPTFDRDISNITSYQGNVLSVAREDNYLILDRIFREVAALFPNQYIHIGGDEVDHNVWKSSPEHRALMTDQGMNNASQLQVYFMLRLNKLLKSHGKKMMGWSEIIASGYLPKETAVMARSSVNAGLEAAKKDHPIIMAPVFHSDFSIEYPRPNMTEQQRSDIVDLERAYNWNPIFTEQLTLTSAQQKLVKGVQCILWTEYATDIAGVEYKAWPRACATAEVGWTDQNQRNWSDFSQRIGLHLSYLDTLNVRYRIKPPRGVLSNGKISIQPPYPMSTIVYTTDGSEPTADSLIYRGETFALSELEFLRFRTLATNGRLSEIATGAEQIPVGDWTSKDIIPQKKTMLSYPVSIDSDGLWFVDLKRDNGIHNLIIHSARIRSNSQNFNSLPLSNNLLTDNETTRLKFNLFSINPNANYQVDIIVEGIGGNDTQGTVTFDKSMFREPTFSVMTNVTHFRDRSIAKLSDYLPNTYFHSDRNIFKGDTWTLKFTAPVLTSKVAIPTGVPGTNREILITGTLEYSIDGTTWLPGVPFTLGSAMIIFDKPQVIRALRITATENQDSWLIIRDPLISP